ncbi:MAG: energy transducer TonB [Bacteroidales bacterium]|jgi:protein TonB|nr:energy transducer TonB [Bacteroidales bacterium]
METKKSKKANLETKRNIFTLLGLVFSLTIVLMAFEWKTYANDENALSISSVSYVDPDVIIPTIAPPPPPAPPVDRTNIEIEIVMNNIDDDFDPFVFDNPTDGLNDDLVYYAPVEKPEVLGYEEPTLIPQEYAAYPGGEGARMEFLRNNLHYPAIAIEIGAQGTVYLRFIVEKDGSLSNVEVVRGIGAGCDEEALRVAKLMPKWTPGKNNGLPVRSYFSMPIKFTLKNS